MAINDLHIRSKPSVEVLGSIASPSENSINCATTGLSIAAADTAGVLRLPAGAVVTQFLIDVQTAETGTLDIGIRGGTATQFFNDIDISSTGVTFSTTPNYKNESGAEEIVEIDPSALLNSAVFQVFALYSVSEL